MIAIILLLSLFTYLVVESRTRINKITRLVLLFSFVIVNLFALWIYHIGGAVRDVPELGIRKGAADPTIFERYTDRIYQFDHDFSNSDKRRKILVIGNSFARDFANILLESQIADSIQLSYHYGIEDCPITRIQQCDRIYFFGWKHQVPASVWNNLRKGVEVWGIGTKNHGTSNGIFYKHRYRADYFAQRTTIHDDFHTINQKLKEEWGLYYIDLLSLTLSANKTVTVFTPNHYFITYDGMHLTPAGTNYYVGLLKTAHF